MKFKTKLSMFLTVFLILGCSITAISANEDIIIDDVTVLEETNTISNFTDLQKEINNNTVVNLTSNVTWQNGEKEINIINKTVTIEGYGYIIDACNSSRIFNVTGSNLTLKNVKLCNGFSTGSGGGMYIVNSTCNLVNCTFNSNFAKEYGAGIFMKNHTNSNIYNCTFNSNLAQFGSSICICLNSNCNISNSNFMNTNDCWSSVYVEIANLSVYNSNFYNLTSNYASAIGSYKSNVTVNNSKFNNLKSNRTAGAIGVKDTIFKLSNCEFINTTSTKNGGAIYIDVSDNSFGIFNITSSSFINCSSGFGGAITILNQDSSVISDCNFTGNIATFNGGAIYTSCTSLTITGSNFRDNKADCTNQTSQIIDYGNGGALYLDALKTNLLNCILINNSASSQGGAIYSYDETIVLNNTNSSSNSKNNSYGVYNVFLNNYTSINSNINDTLLFNSTYYATVVGGTGAKLTLVNDSIVITNYTKFDLRDYGWVTPVKDQGRMGACWAFGTMAAIESALLKKTNTTYNLSENNMQDSMLQSSPFGIGFVEGGNLLMGVAYAVSWLGVFSSDYDAYDELGKLSPFISTENAIHIQDVMFINRTNATDNSAIKEALMKYGAVTVTYCHEDSAKFYNESTHAYYYNGNDTVNHGVCIVGWDDNYSKDNFVTTPPGDGAFIVKNSWGTSWGEDGYFYMSYYNTLVDFGVFIINNTTPYNKNYQLDFSKIINFNEDYSYYSNNYISSGNDSIAAVGTYFNKSGVNYEVKVYINDELKHVQSGLSPFYGYSTIPLSKNITVCENDNISVVMKSNSVPYSLYSRVYLADNTSFVSTDGENWTDLATFDNTPIACLKVYTVEFDLKTSNLTKYYGNDSRFIADLGGSNLTAIFNINGVNYTRVSNESGIASLAINLAPGEYNITTTALSKVNLNTVNVLSTINGSDVTKIFKNGTKFIASFTDSAGNVLVNKTVQFNIHGVIYTKTTDSNGTASLNINLNPGEYIITSINGNESKGNNITVLSTISSSDIVKYYRNGTKYCATFYDSNNNTLANQSVQFNINGVLYTKNTDSNGVATLNINLQPGNYIITAISPNGESKANNILVKSVLIGEDLNKTVTEAKAYEVILVDGEGTPFAGEEVIMNIHGVFYNKTTDNGGIAKLNINLDVGDYIITTTWNGTYTTNKINVRS